MGKTTFITVKHHILHDTIVTDIINMYVAYTYIAYVISIALNIIYYYFISTAILIFTIC